MDTNKRVEQVDIGEESVGRTPLMFAAYYNDMESLEILVASNARVQLKDKKGRTAMHYAAQTDFSKVLEALFLVAKASPAEVKEATKYEKLEEVGADFKHGNVNEKFHTMDT